MGDISNALQAMKTLFLSIDPTPQTALVDAWVFQDEQSSIDLTTLPIAIVLRQLNRQEIWRQDGNDINQHDWGIEVLLFLRAGAILNDAMGAESEAMCDPWQLEVTKAIRNNRRLGGQVLGVGEFGSNVLYRSEISQLDWNNKTFWGIRFLFQVAQSVTY